jgi:hypothetical protein
MVAGAVGRRGIARRESSMEILIPVSGEPA